MLGYSPPIPIAKKWKKTLSGCYKIGKIKTFKNYFEKYKILKCFINRQSFSKMWFVNFLKGLKK